jgi:hypothetical protein
MSMDLPSSLLPILESTLKQDAQLWTEATRTNLHQAGLLLNVRAARPDEDRFAEKDYWNAFLGELRELLCTESAKYRTLRQRVTEAETVTSKVIVPAVAGAIGATLGIAQAVLVPFVALALFAIVQLSVNGWCAVSEEEMHKSLAEMKPSKKEPFVKD